MSRTGLHLFITEGRWAFKLRTGSRKVSFWARANGCVKNKLILGVYNSNKTHIILSLLRVQSRALHEATLLSTMSKLLLSSASHCHCKPLLNIIWHKLHHVIAVMYLTYHNSHFLEETTHIGGMSNDTEGIWNDLSFIASMLSLLGIISLF